MEHGHRHLKPNELANSILCFSDTFLLLLILMLIFAVAAAAEPFPWLITSNLTFISHIIIISICLAIGHSLWKAQAVMLDALATLPYKNHFVTISLPLVNIKKYFFAVMDIIIAFTASQHQSVLSSLLLLLHWHLNDLATKKLCLNWWWSSPPSFWIILHPKFSPFFFSSFSITGRLPLGPFDCQLSLI